MIMNRIQLKAFGKLNLGLDITGKRPDGYHELRMVMQTVKLYDTVMIEAVDGPVTGPDGIYLKVDKEGLPGDETNIVYRAIKLMKDKYGIRSNIYSELTKHIPMAAGMAGGSADAASALMCMNYLFKLGLSKEELCECGLKLGADVPFCIMRGTMLCEGIGEVMTPLRTPPYCHILIAKPGVGASTAAVYREYDALSDPYHPDIDALVKALGQNDLDAVAKACGNTLEDVTAKHIPEIKTIEHIMYEGNALLSMMTGSGPAVFGLFKDREDARRVYKKLRRGGPEMGRVEVYLTEWQKQRVSGRLNGRK